MANLGPKPVRRSLSPLRAEKIPYAIERFTNEMNRLYGVMNKRLKEHRFLAGAYSIADMACVGWIRHAERQGESFAEFPHLSAGSTRCGRGRRFNAACISVSRRPARSMSRSAGSRRAVRPAGAVRSATFAAWLSECQGRRLAQRHHHAENPHHRPLRR